MTRDSKLMLSRIGMQLGSLVFGACIASTAITHSAVTFVCGCMGFGVSLYSWLTNMELAGEK
jgi:hypothetical protein